LALLFLSEAGRPIELKLSGRRSNCMDFGNITAKICCGTDGSTSNSKLSEYGIW